MPVSANIFQQYLQAPKSVNDYRAEMDGAEARQNALATAAMEAKARQQAMQDEEAYRGAVSASGGDQNALIKALNAQGLGTRAQAVQKSMLDAQKIQSGIDVDKSTAGKNTQSTEQAAQQAHIQAAGMIQTPEDAVSWAAEAVRKGIMTPQQFQTGLARIPNDPAGMQQWKQQVQQGGMTVLQQLSSVEPKPTEVKLGNVVKFLDMNPRSPTFGKELAPPQQIGQSPDNAASTATQIRGQNITAQGQTLADARARERMDFDKAGGVSAAGGANAKLTESEGKNTLYLSQMRDASNTLDTLGKASPAMVAATGSPYTNWMAGKNAQKVGQTQRQWAEAYLRAKTGAAATQGEVDNNIRTFFPVLGDDEETIKQKMGARRQAENDMEIPAGRGAERAVKRGGSATANRPPLTDIFK